MPIKRQILRQNQLFYIVRLNETFRYSLLVSFSFFPFFSFLSFLSSSLSVFSPFLSTLTSVSYLFSLSSSSPLHFPLTLFHFHRCLNYDNQNKNIKHCYIIHSRCCTYCAPGWNKDDMFCSKFLWFSPMLFALFILYLFLQEWLFSFTYFPSYN